ncbi:hypothetical protein BOA8489_04054 [Boseongicola aestuarii]|uniref:Uncharacterized protein n=1 Tax=Boseongicola aestuarii TaxID=1470561 RepID=A0A238J582_9RHOB|nr:hypothetical protein BOA8489_04054 [Boseongicola aestuarii]
MSATQSSPAGSPNAVQLINEDDRGGLAACRLEHLTHPAGTDPHEDLDELRAGRGKKRNVRLTCKRTRQQRLAGARWPHQQHTMRHFGSDTRKSFRIAQEIDQFGDLALGAFLACHVRKGHLASLTGRFGKPSGHQIAQPLTRQARAGRNPSCQKEIKGSQEDPRQKRPDDRTVAGSSCVNLNIICIQQRQQFRIVLHRDSSLQKDIAAMGMRGQIRLRQYDAFDPTIRDLPLDFGIRHRLAGCDGTLKQWWYHEHHQESCNKNHKSQRRLTPGIGIRFFIHAIVPFYALRDAQGQVCRMSAPRD